MPFEVDSDRFDGRGRGRRGGRAGQPRSVPALHDALVGELGEGVVLVLRVVPEVRHVLGADDRRPPARPGVAWTVEAGVVTPHSVQTFDPGVGVEPRVERHDAGDLRVSHHGQVQRVPR